MNLSTFIRNCGKRNLLETKDGKVWKYLSVVLSCSRVGLLWDPVLASCLCCLLICFWLFWVFVAVCWLFLVAASRVTVWQREASLQGSSCVESRLEVHGLQQL